MSKIKQAIILAGGKGTRLKPYTISMPKPLVPVGGKPILENVILNLKKNNFKKIILSVNHMADMIIAYFGNGEKFGVSIEYIIEEKPLSTMGPLKLINNLENNFLVLNGDVLTDLNLNMFFNQHLNGDQIFTISAFKRVEKIDYGVLEIDSNNILEKMEEKPEREFLVSMGIYTVNKKVLDFIPKNKFFGFDHLMEKLIENGEPVKVFCYDGYWLDIGRPSDYEKAIKDFGN